MNKLTKMVNIYPSMPITTVNPPIRTTIKRVTKSIEEIRACLMARAIVEEILPDGTITKLNIGNYDKFTNNEVQNKCNCNGECNCGWKIDVVSVLSKKSDEEPESQTKSLWQIEYEKALNGVDLSSMPRKQRRSVIASAKAAADEAVRNAESNTEEEVKIGVGTVETVEESVNEEVEDTITETDNEEVQTLDVEDIEEDSVEELSNNEESSDAE